jgi:XTP/dITP diphosphohydrolase
MTTILVATRNQGKLREIRELLAPSGFGVVGLDELRIAGDAIEDGETFEANALIKAAFFEAQARVPVIADDSGLCVEALGGRPGVFSARFAGPGADDAANNAKLLREMAGVADRRATFVCVAACRRPDGAVLTARGECAGALLDAPRGVDGFGYDPLFFVPHLNATFAELPLPVKNEISHRGRALRALARKLPEFLK